ncbi:hypothetical protein SBOR_9506 [Sclerotinia borealis F-4128]|uniref:Uncharacterized protein n=1 Tax=Sclerotinia borealis (strain F-4128) TaxID=1432307 RepID=W9C317_SCLBF|nr:hypothetical protein SBOR_9506 [Sclerotinia borealis F-4128]
MNPSTSSPESEMALKSDYERLNSITTQTSRTSDEDQFADKGKGKEIEMQETQSTPELIRRERSPTPSMLMRRKTEGEVIKSGPKSAGMVDKRARFDEGRNRGKGEKKDSGKRRHSNNEHANVYTECGRHSDDWLFGGFSVSGAMKKIWQKDGKDSG